jgi:hypothetical protein
MDFSAWKTACHCCEKLAETDEMNERSVRKHLKAYGHYLKRAGTKFRASHGL